METIGQLKFRRWIVFALFLFLSLEVNADNVRVLILLLRYPGSPTPFTATQAQNNFSSTTDLFYENASYNQVVITEEAHGWYVLPCNRNTCTWEQLDATAVDGALAEGVDVTSFTHRYYLISGGVPNSVCGGSPCGVLGTAWDNPNINDPTTQIHEFGHSLGLGHGDIGPIGGGGVYGTDSETLLAAQRYNLGWLTGIPITVSGTYTLTSVEQSSVAYSIQRYDGTKYILDYRQSYYGFPVLYIETEGYYTYVMPDPCGGLGLRIGRSYYDATDHVLVTLNNGNVTVTFDAQTPSPCLPSPTPTATPSHGHKR